MSASAEASGALDDLVLVERARSGDHEAFAVLHARYERLVVSVVQGEIRRGPAAADVDDVIQEAFTLAWQRLDSLRDSSRFRPWLTQIARRCVIDHARRAGRRPALDGDDELAIEFASDPDDTPDVIAELSELVGQLRHALDGMTRRDATAITMAAQFGFGPTEIADALGITPNNAKVVLHRARTRLRAALVDEVTSEAV